MRQTLLRFIFIIGICFAFALPCFSQTASKVKADSNSNHQFYVLALAQSAGQADTDICKWALSGFPNVRNINRSAGKVTISIIINPDGDIAEAHFDPTHTTLADTALIKKCEIAVKSSKLTFAGSSPPTFQQKAQIVYRFEVK